MKITIFSSGSCGNCTLIKASNVNILVDAGISRKAIEDNLSKNGLTLKDIQYLFITHEHIDHVRALASLIKKNDLQVYITKGTYQAYYNMQPDTIKELLDCKLANGYIILLNRIDNSFMYPEMFLNDLHVSVLPTFHDAVESVGYVFEAEDKRIVYITDTGYVHHALYDLISNAECYVVESNHDPEILMHSARPYQTKLRIISDHGHMSNEDSMVVLANVMGDKTKLVMHAHISQECNLTQIVELTRKKVFDDYGIDTSDIEFVITSPLRTKEYDI